jgi:hypothetical protein
MARTLKRLLLLAAVNCIVWIAGIMLKVSTTVYATAIRFIDDNKSR